MFEYVVGKSFSISAGCLVQDTLITTASSSTMATPLQKDWTDREFRKEALQACRWHELVSKYPVLSQYLRDPCLSDDYREWTGCDKLAYFCLLESSDNPARVAEAFNIAYKGDTERQIDLQNAAEDARVVWESLSELQKMLRKFEPLIRSRWTKKHQAAREKLLHQADPDCPHSHMPDIHHVLGHWTEVRPSPYQERDFLFPHINYEDLLRDQTLLRLINCRGRNEPNSFAKVDLDAVQPGIGCKKLPFDVLPVEMDLESPLSSGRYGVISPFSWDDAVSIALHRKMAASDGMLVLKVEAHILVFLRDCCRLILHDKMGEVDDDSIPRQPNPGPLPAQDEGTEGNLWEALQRPYMSRSAVVDLKQILARAQEALDEARDHLWALKEDPSFFQMNLREYIDHSHEHVKDSFRRHHWTVELPDNGFLHSTVLQMVLDAYEAVFEGELLISLVPPVIEQQMKLEAQTPGAYDPEDVSDYQVLLFKLRYGFDGILLPVVMQRVERSFLTDPLFRHNLFRPDPYTLNVQPVAPAKLIRDPLYGLMALMGQQNSFTRNVEWEAPTMPTVSLEDILLEVQRVVATDKNRNAELSPLAEKTMAQAGFYADMRSQLTRHRPLLFSPYRGLGYDAVFSVPSRMRQSTDDELRAMDSKSHDIRRVLFSDDFPKLGKYLDLKLFAYPSSKSRTLETTKAMHTAEQNLDRFWIEFYKAVTNVDPVFGKQLEATFPSGRKLARVESWVQPESTVWKTLSTAFDTTANLESQVYHGLPQDEGSGSGSSNKAALLREAGESVAKVKTRGVADPSRTEEAAAEAEEEDMPEVVRARPVFQVPRRVMAAVDMFFHQEGLRDLPADIDWTEVKFALTAMGFSSAPIFGSKTRFTPVSEALLAQNTRSIVVHAPHPSPKMHFVNARHLGEKLNANFRIDASSFVVREAE
jgi:hypothetical protein